MNRKLGSAECDLQTDIVTKVLTTIVLERKRMGVTQSQVTHMGMI